MISVGFYYKVKKGHEQEFEKVFNDVIEYLKKNVDGFVDAKLYRSVTDTSEYLIYSEWKDLDSYRKFTSSEAYRNTVTYGKTIIEDRPFHKVFQQINA